jgi:aldehyde dehydrogenase (NAD+)
MTSRTMTSHRALLDKLGIEDVNAGACSGPDRWVRSSGADRVVSANPTTGEPIAAVELTTEAS